MREEYCRGSKRMHEGLIPAFRAVTTKQFEAAAPLLLAADIRTLEKDREGFRVAASKRAGTVTTLWFCDYGANVALAFAEADYFRVQMPFAGQAVTEEGRRKTGVSGEVGCISRGGATIAFQPGFQQFAWRVPVASVTKILSALIGEPLVRPLEFDPVLDLAGPMGRRLRMLAEVLASSPAPGESKFGLSVDLEIEQTMIVTLLAAANHTYRAILDRNVDCCAPKQVRAVEMYIQENWSQPIDYEALASLSAVSVRTLFRTFKSFRGYTPLEFAKKVRLQKAHEMLLSRPEGMAVGAIATACGFPNFSAFSRDFAAAYGVPPSSIRRFS